MQLPKSSNCSATPKGSNFPNKRYFGIAPKMEVTVVETARIRPSRPPFTEPHTLSLSHLDTDPNLNVTFRYLRVYANSSSSSTPYTNHNHPIFHVMSYALSSALVHYYPLAAALRPAEEDGRLELRCCLDKLGLPLVNATVSCTLEEVKHLDDPDPGFVDRLAPDFDPDESLADPFALQVTAFACGGFVVGACVHHALCDGIGATQFFTAVADMARGMSRSTIDPVWDRTELLSPRDIPRVGGVVGEFLRVERGLLHPYNNNNLVGGGTERVWFDVKESWVAQLKKELVDKSGSKFTTFEALGSFIWRAKVKASGIPDTSQVKFAYSVNIRKTLTPPLPAGYWGNGCVPMYARAPAKDVTQNPLWETANLIKKSKANANDEYVRAFIDFQGLHSNPNDGLITAGDNVSGFTDWRHLGHAGVDFGWGGPVNVVPLSGRLLGSVEPCFFLPYSLVGDKEEDGFKVMVVLKEGAVAGFRAEMEMFGRQIMSLI